MESESAAPEFEGASVSELERDVPLQIRASDVTALLREAHSGRRAREAREAAQREATTSLASPHVEAEEARQAEYQNSMRLLEVELEKLKLEEREQDVAERRADVEDRKQAHDLRARFFWFSVFLLGLAILSSAAALGAYMWSQWRQIVPAVMVGFFGSIVVEVIGLAAIVARYLFTNHRRQQSPTAADEA